MSKLLKTVIGLSFTLLVLLMAIFFFLRYQVVKSFPDYSGVIEDSLVRDKVEIYFDNFGVPSIRAKNENDLWFAIGYVHAQDRLWQMDIYRRTMQGRLSEIFGKDAVEYDYLFRTLDISSVVKEIQKTLNEEVRNALSSYADGVNAYIKNQKGKYPVEFDILDYEPELWNVEHSLLIARLMAWYLNFSWMTEIVNWKIREKIGVQKAQEIFSDYPKDGPVIVGNIPKSPIIKSITSFLEVVRSHKKFLGINNLGVGSNCWVVSGEKSISGKPILANDPHLTLPVPSHWYEMNYSLPEYSAGGFCFPGTPFIIIGHNNRIAWGLTNAMIDDADFFINVIDPNDSTKYINNRKSFPIQIKEEIIKIGKNDSINVRIKKTHHGPVVNDIHSSIHKQSSFSDSLLISFKWVGFEPTLETYTFYLLNKAKTREDFIKALQYYGVPGQNFLYADVEGNIGYHLAAKIPIRSNFNPTFPAIAFNTECDWVRFVPFEDLPKIWNPPEHYIVSANNKIINNPNYYITNLYMPPYRAERILQLLNVEKNFSIEDFKQYQTDLVSLHAQKYNKIILDVFSNENVTDQLVISAIEYLKNWDFNKNAYDAATSIFNMFYLQLLKNTFRDELGEELFNEYIHFPAFPINSMDKLIETESSWFDCVDTDTIEDRLSIIKKSFLDAINELKIKYGSEIKNWQWGNLHQLTLEHPLGKVQPLNYVFNLGSYKIGGSSTTINNSEIDFTKPFEAEVGPSIRFIVDLSSVLKRYCVIAGGQSGHAIHKHYSDQIDLWLNGKYREVNIDYDLENYLSVEKLHIIPIRR